MKEEEKIVCPKCGCDDENIRLLNTNRKIFTAGGAGVGGVAGYFAKQAGTRFGMMLGAVAGSAVPGIGTAIGTAAGGVAGAVAGMLTGAAIGNLVGGKIDLIAGTLRCNKCGRVFEA